MSWVFGPEARGILALQPGIKPTTPALEGEAVSSGPPGKSQEELPFSAATGSILYTVIPTSSKSAPNPTR